MQFLLYGTLLYTFELNLLRCRGSKFRNPSFYLHFLANTSSVVMKYVVMMKFVFMFFQVNGTQVRYPIKIDLRRIFMSNATEARSIFFILCL